MFNNLRSSGHSILTRIMLIFIVLSFVLWGVGDIFRQSGGEGAVAKVGNASVSRKEFQQVLRNQQEELREKLGKAYSPEFAKRIGIEKRALESIVNRLLLEQESTAREIVVGEEDILDSIAQNPNFQDSQGQFSKDIYFAALQHNQMSEQHYISSMRSQLASSLLLDVVTSDIAAPEAMVLALYRVRSEKRVAGLLTIPFTVSTAGKPSEQELKAYYDAHPDKYLVPEYRSLSYVELKEEDIKASVTISDAEVQKAYESRAEEFQIPELRTVEQLVFEKKDDADKASAELAAGKAFTDVAESMPIINKGKLLLGDLAKEKLPISVEAATEVFALKEGGISTPAESPFGWHILRVTKITHAGARPLAEVREQIVKDISSNAVQEAVYKLSNRFEDAMGGGATLEEAAEKIGQKVYAVVAVTRDGAAQDGSKPAMPAYKNFLEVAFATKEKDHSRMMQADNGSYFMVRVDSIKKEQVRPLADVLSQVNEAVIKELNDKHTRELAQQIAKDLKAGKKLEEVVAGQGIAPVLESSGALLRSSEAIKDGKLAGKFLPPELMAELFQLKPKTYTHAHALSDGGYMIGLVEQVIPAEDISKQGADTSVLTPIREELEQSLGREIQFYYLQHLRKKYPVTVNNAALGAVTDSDGQ